MICFIRSKSAEPRYLRLQFFMRIRNNCHATDDPQIFEHLSQVDALSNRWAHSHA
jgi:hypothetical protein